MLSFCAQLFTTLLMMLGSLTAEQAEFLKGKPLTKSLEDDIKHYIRTSKLQTSDVRAESGGESSDCTQAKTIKKAVANLSSLCAGKEGRFSGTAIDKLFNAVTSTMETDTV